MTDGCSSERRKEIEENLDRVRRTIADAERAAGRAPGEVTLIGVTKTMPVEDINAALDHGLAIVGENRAQELLEKLPQIHPQQVHFIGTLQSNKVKYLAGCVDMIQSASSLALLREIDRQATRAGRVLEILLEVNIGAEESKSGFAPEQVPQALEAAAGYANLRVRGLMAIPPAGRPAAETTAYFTKMQKLFIDNQRKLSDNINMTYLSMGMSGDFAEAIREGANMVRVGTAIFGKRNYLV